MKERVMKRALLIAMLLLPLFAQAQEARFIKERSALPTACYRYGEVLVYDNTLYRCTVIGNPGTWSEVGSAHNALATFDAGATFSSGTFTFNNGANFSGGTFNFSGATVTNLARVTSVGLSLPDIFSVSGSPVTTTGTLAASLASQSQNSVFAGPTSGSGAPAFRALVAGDIPSLDVAKITTGIFGTGRLGSGTANSSVFLRGDGTWATPSWDGGTVSNATTFSSSVTTNSSAGLRIGTGATLKNAFGNDFVVTTAGGGNAAAYLAKAYTNSSTYEVLAVGWSGVPAWGYYLQALSNGGGSYYPISISPSAASPWTFDTDGTVGPQTDNANDVGKSSSRRPKSIYAGTSVIAPTVGLSTTLTWTSGSGAPSGACGNGSLYTRTDATGGLYLCVNTAWVAK